MCLSPAIKAKASQDVQPRTFESASEPSEKPWQELGNMGHALIRSFTSFITSVDLCNIAAIELLASGQIQAQVVTIEQLWQSRKRA